MSDTTWFFIHPLFCCGGRGTELSPSVLGIGCGLSVRLSRHSWARLLKHLSEPIRPMANAVPQTRKTIRRIFGLFEAGGLKGSRCRLRKKLFKRIKSFINWSEVLRITTTTQHQ